jgi:NodT family efflux transporter outer membrane factor (OMF) lipoprotein
MIIKPSSYSLKLLKAMLSLELIVSLCGCLSVGPDFSRPPTKTSDQYKPTATTELTAAINESNNQNIDPVKWWESFGDPTLNELLQKVKAQNLSLQQSALRVYQYQSQLGVSDSKLLPNVSLNGSTLNSKNSSLQEITNNTNNLLLNSVIVQLNWELDFWGKFRRGVESSYSSYLSTIAAFYSADVSLSADVANTYVNIRNYESLIDVAKSNLALQAESLRIAAARFKYGATSMLDLSQAQAQYDQTKAEIPSLYASLKKSQYAMSLLLGEVPDYYEKNYGNTKSQLTVPPELGVGIPKDLLRRRPDVLQAEFNAAAQSALIGVNKAALYPTLTLGGTFGFANSNYGTTNSGQLFSWGNNAASVSGGLLFPLFYRGAIVDQIRVQDAVFQQSLLAYQNQVLTAQKEVEDALITISTSKSSSEDLKRAVSAASSAANLSLERYKSGQNDYTTVISAQQSLLKIQNSDIQTASNQLLGYVAAFKALGGGWSAEMKAPQLPTEVISEMSERTDWGSVLTRGDEPLTVRAAKFVSESPDPSSPVVPIKVKQGSTAP